MKCQGIKFSWSIFQKPSRAPAVKKKKTCRVTSNNKCLWTFFFFWWGPSYATHQTDEGALGAKKKKKADRATGPGPLGPRRLRAVKTDGMKDKLAASGVCMVPPMFSDCRLK